MLARLTVSEFLRIGVYRDKYIYIYISAVRERMCSGGYGLIYLGERPRTGQTVHIQGRSRYSCTRKECNGHCTYVEGTASSPPLTHTRASRMGFVTHKPVSYIGSRREIKPRALCSTYSFIFQSFAIYCTEVIFIYSNMVWRVKRL